MTTSARSKKTGLLRASTFLLPLLQVALGMAPVNIEDQLDSLAKMTESEKLGQLQQLDGLPDGTVSTRTSRPYPRWIIGLTLNVPSARRTNELRASESAKAA